MNTAYDLIRRSFSDLIEHNIPLADEKRIQEIICDHASEYAGFLT